MVQLFKILKIILKMEGMQEQSDRERGLDLKSLEELKTSKIKLSKGFFDQYGVEFTIFLFVVVAIFSPFLLTRSVDGWLNFTETGQIGDTIGGLTGPIIGILNAVLLWWTLRKQGQQIAEQNLQNRIERKMSKLENMIANVSITIHSINTDEKRTHHGRRAFLELSNYFYSFDKVFEVRNIEEVEWDIVLMTIRDIQQVAIHIANLNLDSNGSIESKNYVFLDINEYVYLTFELVHDLEIFEKNFNDVEHAYKYFLSPRKLRHFNANQSLFDSRNPIAIKLSRDLKNL